MCLRHASVAIHLPVGTPCCCSVAACRVLKKGVIVTLVLSLSITHSRSRHLLGSTLLQQHHAETLQLLGAIERPSRLSPRDRLELGLLPSTDGDDSSKGVDKLLTAAVASLTGSHETTFGIRCLSALGELCQELECSERLGLIGGHQVILRLMAEGCGSRDACRHEDDKLNLLPPAEKCEQPHQAHNGNGIIDVAGTPAGVDTTCAGGKITTGVSGLPAAGDNGSEEQEGEEDEVQSAAALVAARVVSSGSSFPMRLSFPAGDESSGMGRFPLRYDFVVANSSSNPTHCTRSTMTATVDDGSAIAAKGLGVEKPNEGCTTACGTTNTTSVREHPGGDFSGGDSISILVRPVTERQHSQFDVGFVMWPASVILSRLLCRHPETVRGRRVLEIGAGLGLAGLVAARIQQIPSSAPTLPQEELAMDGRRAVGSSGRAGLAPAASVTLSDFNPLVLRALEANVALNARSGACCAADDVAVDAGEVGEGVRGFRLQSSEISPEGEDGRTPRRDAGLEAGRQTVHVRHLDWDKLKCAPDVNGRWSSSLGNGDDSDARVPRPPTGGGVPDNGKRCTSGECSDNDAGLPLDGTASRQQRGGVKGIEQGGRFDVIIASDHICQVLYG